MNAGGLDWISVAEAGRLIRGRDLSPVDLIQACLQRTDQLENRLNAFITVTGDEALRGAKAAAEEIAGGKNRGPLHGIPVALKDIFAVAGVRLTAGSKILAENVASEDAEATARLRGQGR